MAANQTSGSSSPSATGAEDHTEHEMQQSRPPISEGIADNPPVNEISTTVTSNMVGKPTGNTHSVESSTNQSDTPSAFHAYRFQICLKNGYFTNDLRDELLSDLNNSLFQMLSDSFIPSFNGHGLRFGKIWFSPENKESADWLMLKLQGINEKAVDSCKFVIEPFGLHQNKLCLNVPLISSENLSNLDVLKRLHFQNPNLGIVNWKIVRTKATSTVNRLIICSVDDCSHNLLKTLNFKLNYGFQKVICKPYMQKKAAKTTNVSVRLTNLA